jgi:hypothetical protein
MPERLSRKAEGLALRSLGDRPVGDHQAGAKSSSGTFRGKMSRDQEAAFPANIDASSGTSGGAFAFLVVKMVKRVKVVRKWATEHCCFLTILSTLTILTAFASGKHRHP